MFENIPPLQSMASYFVVFLSKYVSASPIAKKGNVWTRHAYNPSTLQAEVGGSEVQVSSRSVGLNFPNTVTL